MTPRKILLTQTAESKLDHLLSYLETNWSENVKFRFLSKLEDRIEVVTQKPEAFPKSSIKKNLYKCVITKQTTMYYTFDEQHIYILTIFDNRQDPEQLIKDLE